MGLFDNLLQTATQWTGGMSDEHAKLAHGVLDMISRGESGGLAGLVQGFQDNGLGNVVSSWISTGNNLPISPDQIQATLGDQQIAALAKRVGVSPDVAKAKLAEVLPIIVDRLTPNGQMPAGGSLLGEATDLLKKSLS